jgi:peptide/nickel transport system substrate-binding protein
VTCRCRWHGVIAVAALFGAACTADRPDGDAIIVGIANSPTILDPRIGTDEYSQKAHQLIFNTLMKIDDKLRVVPDLAESLDDSDPLNYIVRLRQGIRFHNGRELTSDDVVYTFGSFLDPKFGGRSGAYRTVGAVKAIDRYTVQFVLKRADASFRVNLVMGIVQAGSGTSNVRQPVGTGPYKVAEFVPDDRLVLEPFADYWGGAPSNTGIILKVVPDDTMRGLELRKGTVDIVVNDVAPDIVSELRQEGRLKLAEARGTDYAYLGFNLKHPLLGQREVRRAIGYALNREAIVTYLRRGLADVALGLIPPMSWAFASDVFRFDHAPDLARRLLDDAGLRDPDGDGPLPRFALTVRTSTSEIYRLQAAAIQHDLAAVGIHLDVRSTETQTLFADIVRGNFQMYTAVFVGITDPDMLRRVFHSGQQPPVGLNRVFYQNPEVDRLIEEGARVTEESARQMAYARAQRIIADDVPYLPLWYRTNVAVFQPDIAGVVLSPVADFTFLKDVHRVPAAH